MPRLFICLFGLAFFSGCSTSYLFKPDPSYPQTPVSPPAPCEVKVYRTAPVGREYKVIGTCTAWSSVRFTNGNTEKALRLLKKCACEYGGNAVILTNHVQIVQNMNERRAYPYQISPIPVPTATPIPAPVHRPGMGPASMLEVGAKFKGEVVILEPF